MQTAFARRPAGREALRRLTSTPWLERGAVDKTHPFTPLTYNDGALLPQVWTAESASTTACVVTMALA